MSARREARRRQSEDLTPTGVPARLAAGPCAETWGSGPDDLFGAWRAWKEARLVWAQAHGLADVMGHLDYHHLPAELYDRAPFRRDAV